MKVLDAARKASSRLLQGLAEHLRVGLMLLAMRLFPRVTVDGVQLVPLVRADDHTEIFFRKVSDALTFLRAHDPHRYRRLVLLLKRIALVPDGGEYLDTPLSTYVMDVPTLVQRPAPSLALKIVHEVAHLRLIRARIPYSDSLRDRIEEICIRQEIEFAEKTPPELGLLEEAKRKLGQRWWDDAAREERHARYLRAYPLPAWIRKTVRVLFRLEP